MILTTNAALADFCTELLSAPYIAVDTEFVRERTYYAQLCLIQVAHGEHAAVIDPRAPDIDLTPLYALLEDESILKVFHACGQDMEIFLQTMGKCPAPLFDTQIAASVCGFGESPGYAALVSSMLGVQIDKASQRTDWSKRPLSAAQLDYALGDVTHLCKVYERLVAQLDERGRREWVAEEMIGLGDEGRYRVDPEDAWRRVKLRGADRRALALVRELAAWRERAARTRDLPRGWVLHDDVLGEIAQHPPRDAGALSRIRAIKPAFARSADGVAILEIVRQTIARGPDTWPELPPRRIPSEESDAMTLLLQALLRMRCAAEGIAPPMVASRDDLEALAASSTAEIPALVGWRREVFGNDALSLREGRLALTGGEGGVKLVPKP